MKSVRYTALAVATLLAGVPAVAAAEAPFYFMLAKMASEEGTVEQALEAIDLFAKAVEQAPGEPFLRIEYAEVLLRLGRWEQAAEQVAEARRLAADDIDVLRMFGQVHLSMAGARPESLALARSALEELRLLAPDRLEPMMALGRIYLGEGESELAVEVFRQILSYRPSFSPAHSLLVDALMRLQRTAEAEEALVHFLAVDPSALRARLALAELLSERDDHAAAVAVLQAAPPADREDADLRRLLALELYRGGRLQKSLEELEAVLAEDPDYFGGRYLKALILTAEGRSEEAEGVLRGLVDEQPENLDLGLLLARVLERMRRTDAAADHLSGLAHRMRSNGKDAEAHRILVQIAMLRARTEDWEGVLEVTSPLRAEAGSQAGDEVLLLHVDALGQTGRADEALAVLAEISAESIPASQLLAKEAEVLLMSGHDEAAGERLRRLATSPDPDDILLAAEVYQGRERFEEAIPLLERVRESRADSREVLFWLGAAYERTGRRPEAEASFQSLLASDPEFAPALNYLGYMWADNGENLEQALELVRRAVALDPDNGAYVDSLGWALFQLGKYDEAQGYLERAARLVPDDAVVFEHLGDLYTALGRVSEAREVYERALSLDAENSGAVSGKLERLRGER